MQSCTFPLNYDIRRTVNLKTNPVPEQWLNAVVVLEDVGRSLKREDASERKEKRKLSAEKEMETMFSKFAGVMASSGPPLTPPVSPVPGKCEISSRKKRIVTWDPNVEYEIEKILEHRKWKRYRFVYLVKWKGWTEDYNTYEPLENLTNCNYLLMKYFEGRGGEASVSAIEKAKSAIETQLLKYDRYKLLKKHSFKKSVLTNFPDSEFANLNRLFGSDSELNAFEKSVNREYEYVLRCLVSLQEDERDEALFARSLNYRIVLELIRLRRKQLKNLRRSETAINSVEEAEIRIVNNVDLDSFPEFEYALKLRLGEDVVVPVDPPLGCECPTGCRSKSNCCSALADSRFAYNSSKILRIPEGFPIYECNAKCRCSRECPNRVVQLGRKTKLCIFKTESRGWGVKALEAIKRGTFVCEYLGELIGEREANARDDMYHNNGMQSYLFDLDFNPDREAATYSIDAFRYGNVARFINHSCDPNLAVYPVWIDCLDPNLPRLAFFARRSIKRMEEITFDYMSVRDDLESSPETEDAKKNSNARVMRKLRCECKASNCRGWFFGGQ